MDRTSNDLDAAITGGVRYGSDPSLRGMGSGVPSGMLRPGAVVGSLRIESMIGRGAMGEVFRATQINLRRPVAVKRIAEHLIATPEAVARFEREAQTLARVQSPWVVAVHDFARMRDDQGQDHYLLVMELVEGARSLRSCIDTPLAWPEATAVILQVARGLAAAAEHGVVHRDIKPHNIILNHRGQAKLADFGLARSADSTDLTTQGAVLGTPAYMAPEACRGEAVDGRADLYSLGVTWYQLLSGRTPFLADNTPAMLRAHVDDPPPRLETLVPGVPAPVIRLIDRLLAKNPRDRPASATLLVEQLLRLRQEGLVFPDEVVLPQTGELVMERTTAATHVVPGAVPPSTLTAVLQAPSAVEAPTLRTPATAVPSPVVPTAVTVVPAPATTAPPTTSPAMASAAARPASPLRWIALGLVLLVAAGVATWLLLPSAHDRLLQQVRQAATAGQSARVLALVDQGLAAWPGDPDLIATGSAAIASEVMASLAQEGPAAARQLLNRRQASRDWLDGAPLAIRIACAEAERAVQGAPERDRRAVGEQAYAPLVHEHPDDPVVLASVVHALAFDDDSDLLVQACLRLARQQAPPSAEVMTVLERTEATWPESTTLAEIRHLLVRLDPAAIATARLQLHAADADRRETAFLLLAEARALSPTERVTYELQSLYELGSNQQRWIEAIADLETRCQQPDWPQLRAQLTLPPPERITCLDEGPDSVWPRVRQLLLRALPEVVRQRLPGWIDDVEHPDLRWNAWLLAQAAGWPPSQDPAAFHARTLTTFTAGVQAPAVDAALAWCRQQRQTPQEAVAAHLLDDAIAHILHQRAQYEQAGLRLHLRGIDETLALVRTQRAALQPPPAR